MSESEAPKTKAGGDTVDSAMNQWFLSLPEERQKILAQDKWMLANAAFAAGRVAGRNETALHDAE